MKQATTAAALIALLVTLLVAAPSELNLSNYRRQIAVEEVS